MSVKYLTLIVAALMALALYGFTSEPPAEPVGDDGVVMVDAAKAKTLFKKYKCSECHSITKAGIKKTGEDDPEDEVKPPDLSKGSKLKAAPEKLVKYLKKKTKLHDRKHKKKFKGDDADALIIVEWLKSL